jgi:uncharacterized protein (TIGR00369 family)
LPSAPRDLPGLDEIGSGAQALIGYEIDLTPEDGSARIHLDIEDRHRNRNRTLHGGIIAMMLDAAAGFAASRGGADAAVVHVVTISLTTNFIAPATGGRVTATGTLTGGGRSVSHAEAHLRDEDGLVRASASAVFTRLKRPG